MHLEPDEEMGPARGMYGALDAELEVQRAIRGAELKALVSLQKDCRPYHGSC